MSPKHYPAVRYGVEKGVAPIKSRMQSNGVPKISASAQCECKQQSDDRHARRANPILAPVIQVDIAKSHGKQHRRRPESDPSAQCELCVTSEQKLFIQAHHQEQHHVNSTPLQHVPAV